MPKDTRRIPCPEESRSFYDFEKDTKETVALVNEHNQRNDGRGPDQVRPIFLKSGVISQAKGSAYLEMDKTKIMCAVYGPRQVRREDFSLQGQLTCEFKFLTFSCKYRRQHQQDNQEKDYSVILLEALEPAVRLEKFPKAKLDIFVTVLEDDGSSLSGAITAASVALADAGIEMYDLVVGAALRQNGKMVLMDPCGPEEYRPERAPAEVNQGSITVGLMPSMHQVAALALRGELDQQTTAKGIKLCIETCQKIYPVVQECLIQSVKKKLAEQKPE